MTFQAESDHVTHNAERAEPICRRLFTIEQAAEFARVPGHWLCDWIMAGELKEYRLEGGARIDEVDLENFMSGR